MFHVHDQVDPRLFGPAALRAEHLEVHRLLLGHDDRPDYDRFHRLGERGRSLLVLRHEFLRVAMVLVAGQAHWRDNHRTSAPTEEMSPRAAAALLLYERHALPHTVSQLWSPDEIQHFFQRLVKPMNYPPGGGNHS